MKKNKTSGNAATPRAMDAIRLRLIALASVLWLTAMALTTWGLAMDLYRQMEQNATDSASRWAQIDHTSGDNQDAPGFGDYSRMVYMQEWSGLHIQIRPSLFAFGQTDDRMPFGYAVSYSYSDGERVVTQSSDTPYLYFSYLTADEWTATPAPDQHTHYLYIDQSKLDSAYGNTNLYADPQFYGRRLTGWFEGNEFHPVTVETTQFIFGNWESRDNARWETAYECPTPPGQEVVTVYSLDMRKRFWGENSIPLSEMLPITIDGTQYNNLFELLPTTEKSNNLMDAVVRGYDTYVDAEGNTVHIRVALRAQPVKYAMKWLIWFYLITLVMTGLGVWLILRSIRKNLVLPVAQIASRTDDGPLPLPVHYHPRWQEPRRLEDNYSAIATAYHEATTEANQLRTALNYAQNAEENRRKMISGITHELKTPLAIIHSYAEGLCDGIAADKQEQYLKTILDETERMDAMVLEMLDLSRLEAGKVRLATDRFSLLDLTRSVFEKLAPMAKEKQLQIHYTLAEEFDITADEGRIGQVITNLATNAIKYTPAGRNIWVRIYRHQGKTNFILTNECDPLPPEALGKVWDSFYRAETSRTTKGTGLGLTIAKAIIELHGGTVQVRNTSSGVEFQFILP